MLYSWASGKTIVDGVISSYGALYKIPGNAQITRFLGRPWVASAVALPAAAEEGWALHGKGDRLLCCMPPSWSWV